jgi:hypothetical protein
MVKCEYKIIDNIFPKSVADEIADELLVGGKFPWYYNNVVVTRTSSAENDLNDYQFTHIFYEKGFSASPLFSIIRPLVEYLNPEALIRVKANLNPITSVRHIFDYHVDFPAKSSDRKTAIYYVNSNDGVTILEDGTEIESVANRLVIFDQKILHTGTTCTDQKVRCVINLNYIELNND